MATQRVFTAEEAQKKFESLPQGIKDIIYTSEMSSIIQKIGEKNHLHYDQMGRLEMETTNVMLGFSETGDFVSILTSALDVDKNKANEIVQDINEMLFAKVRNSMKEMDVQNTTTISTAPQNPSAIITKSVIMPSSASSIAPIAPKPVVAPTSATPMVIVPPKITPPPAPTPVAINPMEKMLSEPTVSMPKSVLPAAPTTPIAAMPVASVPPAVAKVEPPKPAPYKADPYREPPE